MFNLRETDLKGMTIKYSHKWTSENLKEKLSVMKSKKIGEQCLSL